jgi:hypothetical protein
MTERYSTPPYPSENPYKGQCTNIQCTNIQCTNHHRNKVFLPHFLCGSPTKFYAQISYCSTSVGGTTQGYVGRWS